MLTTAITLATSKKLMALAAASGVAASAMLAGDASLQQEIRAMPAPILVDADLGSLLRLGGGSEVTAEATLGAEATQGAAIATEGSLLSEVSATLGVVEVTTTATGGAAADAETSASAGLQVDLGLSTEAAVEAEAVESTIVADAGGVLGVTLR